MKTSRRRHESNQSLGVRGLARPRTSDDDSRAFARIAQHGHLVAFERHHRLQPGQQRAAVLAQKAGLHAGEGACRERRAVGDLELAGRIVPSDKCGCPRRAAVARGENDAGRTSRTPANDE